LLWKMENFLVIENSYKFIHNTPTLRLAWSFFLSSSSLSHNIEKILGKFQISFIVDMNWIRKLCLKLLQKPENQRKKKDKTTTMNENWLWILFTSLHTSSSFIHTLVVVMSRLKFEKFIIFPQFFLFFF
jgi:hypothetical protein